MESAFYKMIFTHNAISNVKDYAAFIDRSLNSFFIKGKNCHLILDVKTTKKIPIETFYGFGDIFNLTEDFLNEENIKDDADFSIKSNVQSPGILEIIQSTAIPLAIVCVGIIVHYLVGGGFSAKVVHKNSGLNMDIKTNTPVGLIERIGKIAETKRKDKLTADIVKKCLEDMEITTPEDLLKMIEKSKEIK
jgi:hypothetical protein